MPIPLQRTALHGAAQIQPAPQPPIQLKAGERWLMPPGPSPWRLCQGVLRPHNPGEPDALASGLLLPGDLVGVEGLLSAPRASAGLAWTDCRLEPVVQGARSDWLAEGLDQTLQRQQQLLALRCGPVAQRVAALLELIRVQGGAARARLPTLREMALLLDTTVESVSRALAALRRRQARPLRTLGAPLSSGIRQLWHGPAATERVALVLAGA